jgi:hypothetical protein
MSDPTSVFRAAAAALESEAWDEAAALCDPATLSLYKWEVLARLEAARFAEAADPQHVLDEMPGISSIDQLRDMPPARVFAAWLEGQSYHRLLERARGLPDIPPGVLDDAMQHRPVTRYQVLGCIEDGDRLAFVVFRREHAFDEPETETPFPEDRPEGLTDAEWSALQDQWRAYVEFAPLRRQPDGSWRLFAGQQFLGLNQSAFSFGFDLEAESDDGEPGMKEES